MLPLYEAKMLHHFDTRWATYEPDGTTRLMTEEEKSEHKPPMPRYWVADTEVDRKLEGKWDKHWMLGWRDICRATDERTLIATQGPKVGYGHKFLLMFPGRGNRAVLQAALSSFVLDYCVRQKLGGTSASYFVLQQVPAEAPGRYVYGLDLGAPHTEWIEQRVDLLNGWVADPSVRTNLRAELDAYMFLLYGCSRDEVVFIMDSFGIVRRKDERSSGEFVTRARTLEAFDEMKSSIVDGRRYVSSFEVNGL